MQNRTKTKPSLNRAQEKILESTIKWPLNDILQTYLTEPKKADEALTAALTGSINKKQTEVFAEKNILDSIRQINKILTHEYPHYSTQGHPSGLLNLIALNNDEALPVTQPAVANYIVTAIQDAKKLIKSMNSQLIRFLKNNQKQISELWDTCETFRLPQIVAIGIPGLERLIQHPEESVRLINKINITVEELVAIRGVIFNELINHSDDMLRLHEAHLTLKEVFSLPNNRRQLFWQYSSRIHDLIERQHKDIATLTGMPTAEFMALVTAPPQPPVIPVMDAYENKDEISGSQNGSENENVAEEEMEIVDDIEASNDDANDIDMQVINDLDHLNTFLSDFTIRLDSLEDALRQLRERNSDRVRIGEEFQNAMNATSLQRQSPIHSSIVTASTAPTALFSQPSLNNAQIKALSELHEHGLQRSHFDNWGNNTYTETHTEALLQLMINEQHSFEDAIQIVKDLTSEQAQTIVERAQDHNAKCTII